MASTGGSPRGGAARPRAASTTGSSRALGARRPPGPVRQDAVAAGLEVWSSVVAGLESARYAEVGAEYAKLSALLVQQRTAEVLAGTPLRPEWAELSRVAQQALDALEPLLGAARLLATLPAAVPPTAPKPRTRRPTTRSGTKPSPTKPSPTS